MQININSKKLILTILATISTIRISAQDVNTDWLLLSTCDSATTMFEINLCSGYKVARADSVMTSVYNTLLNQLTERLEAESQSLSEKDVYDKEFIENIRTQIKNLKESQEAFQEYKNTTVEIISAQYSHGSMQPLAENSYALTLILERIKILTELNDEIFR